MSAVAPIAGASTPVVALVTGASRGIGLAATHALLAHADVARVFAVSRSAEACPALAGIDDPRLVRLSLDLTVERDLAALPGRVRAHAGSVHLVFNAAGVLHGTQLAPEKSLSLLCADALSQVFALNAFAPILLAQALLPLLPTDAPAVFASLSACVGSIGDNRLGGWYAYRASKAAQNQLLRTLSIEWKRIRPLSTVLLLHPGTVDTDLSRPFQANVAADALFTPTRAARQLLDIIAAATPADSGRFMAWDGSTIPW